MVDENNMHPNASPGKNKVGTRRVNSKPMLIAIIVIGAFVLMMLFVANDKANEANEVNIESPVVVSSNSTSFAQELVGSHDGIIPEEKPKLNDYNNDALGSKVAVQIENVPALDSPPSPSFQPYVSQQNVYDPEKERIDMAKMQMFEQSLRAKTSINIVAPASSGTKNYSSSSGNLSRDEMLSKIAAVRQKINTSGGSGDLTEEYKKRVEMLKNSSILSDFDGGSESSGDIFVSSAEGKTNSTRNKWKIDSELEVPSSPYELRSGFIIPGTLISGINSELPGEIVAQVSQNVYDTATGRYLLIPQGARINGRYNSEVSFGQERIMIAWERIIFPDGRALDIAGMPGADSAGYSGFNDMVNNHYLRIFGSAVFLSGITAGITYNQDKHSSDDKSASGALSEALGQQLGQTAMQMISKNMNVSPTLEVRPGYRFNIIVTKDVSFSKPYQSFDY